MLVDIFSSFDDHNVMVTGSYFFMWVGPMMFFSLFCLKKWVVLGGFGEFFSVLQLISFCQTHRSLGGRYMGGFCLIMCSFFITLVVFNLSGLVPYCFSITAHLSFTLSFGLVMWMSIMISSICMNYLKVMQGFLPSGAPTLINPFLVLVETVSNLCRFLTISIRLMANIGAGHIILSLVGMVLCTKIFSYSDFWEVELLGGIGLFSFEFCVALIQVYIFCLLISLYSNEHPVEFLW
uniref:ATP synthase subunit a n=1 Tax=Paralepetopsis sp. TaxID=3071116 RepID=A0AA96KKF8_9GAST|nr:ATP synthase F0 subunit 6 [Paralepetopsis sp.]